MNLNPSCFAFGLLTALLAAVSGPPQDPPSQTAPAEAVKEPRVGVRFEGFLPGTRDEKLKGEYSVEFRIYLSPQGGEAVWSESQRVRVEQGRMDVVLGAQTPIPMSLHEATFKFLGASVGGGREVYPRFTIVNTVYASTEEALRTPAVEAFGPAAAARAAAPGVYGPANSIVAAETRPPGTWKAALLAARAAGGDLADYQDWYRALALTPRAEVPARTGHYEWVLPWVYDTASHGEYNRLFRGRFQGCDYMDLAPTNPYVWRLALPAQAQETKSGASK